MLPVAKAQSLESALEIVEKAVTDGDIPGATVLVIRDGKTVAARAVGICDRKQQRAFRNDTICWIASLTKRINSVTGVPVAHWSGGDQRTKTVGIVFIQLQDRKLVADIHHRFRNAVTRAVQSDED
jgi:hypothetical protein